jgi:hypothetical protein
MFRRNILFPISEVEEQNMEAVCSSETSVITYNTQDIYNMTHKNYLSIRPISTFVRLSTEFHLCIAFRR